jgi:hypothetical protein
MIPPHLRLLRQTLMRCLKKQHAEIVHSRQREALTVELAENESAWNEFRRKYKVTDEDLNQAVAEATAAA